MSAMLGLSVIRRRSMAAALVAIALGCEPAPTNVRPRPADGAPAAPPSPLVLARDDGRPIDGLTPRVTRDTLSTRGPTGLAPGLGAIVHDGGVTFRVWAPHADAASVIGDFNHWDPSANPLARESGGMFAGEVTGAHPGQAYLYHLTNVQGTFDKADPRAEQMTDARGKSLIVDLAARSWQSAPFDAPPPSGAVIYEMHIGTFNADAQQLPGTFRSAIARLDHVQALGANMVELMPIAEFGTTTSWGYNPSCLFAPESSYGAPEDLQAFVDEAHTRGIGVILDVVHNHYKPNDASLRCFDGDCLGANGIYFYTDAARKDTPWGPRPDYGRPEVRAFIEDNTLFWLERYRVDGFRWDSTINIRAVNEAPNRDGTDMLAALNARARAQFPRAIFVAEDFRNNDRVTDPTVNGGLGFSSQWDGDFFHPVDGAITAADDAARSMAAIAGAITHRLSGRSTARVVYTESHDEVANGKARIPQMISPEDTGSWAARKRSTLGAAIVFTSPGMPMIFMGQEFLENGSFSDHVPLDWSKASSHAGIVQLYVDLIRLRRNLDGRTKGLTGEGVSVHHLNEGAKVIGYRRWQNHGPGDDVVVLANFGARNFTSYLVGVPSPGPWQVRFNSDLTAYADDYQTAALATVSASVQARDGLPFTADLALPPYSVLILSE
jgi:1,4-alpha-glucan branching enzyme